MPLRTPQPPKKNYPGTAALRPNDPNSSQNSLWGLPAGQGQPRRDHQSFLQDYAKTHVGFDYDPQTGQLGHYQIQNPSAQLRGEQPRFQPVGAGMEQWLSEKELDEPSTTRPVMARVAYAPQSPRPLRNEHGATPAPAPDFQCPPGTQPETQRMLTTGYDNSYRSTGKNPGDRGYGVTASQTVAGSGTIAAPKNYPYGTAMYVPGYGAGKVEDRGGAIKNSHIDLWFPTEQAALEWGRRNKDVQVCIVKK